MYTGHIGVTGLMHVIGELEERIPAGYSRPEFRIKCYTNSATGEKRCVAYIAVGLPSGQMECMVGDSESDPQALVQRVLKQHETYVQNLARKSRGAGTSRPPHKC